MRIISQSWLVTSVFFQFYFVPHCLGGTTTKWKNPRCNFRWSQYFFRKIFAVLSKYFPEKHNFRQENGSWEACFFEHFGRSGARRATFARPIWQRGCNKFTLWAIWFFGVGLLSVSHHLWKKIPVPQLSFYFFRSVGPRPNLIDPITSFGNFRGEDHLPIMVGNLGILPLLFCPSLNADSVLLFGPPGASSTSHVRSFGKFQLAQSRFRITL